MILPNDRPASDRLAAFLAEHRFDADDIADITNAAASATTWVNTQPRLTHLTGQLTARPWLGVIHSEGVVASLRGCHQPIYSSAYYPPSWPSG